MGAKKPPRDGAEAEPGLLSLLSRLGPVPRAADEIETPLPLRLAGVEPVLLDEWIGHAKLCEIACLVNNPEGQEFCAQIWPQQTGFSKLAGLTCLSAAEELPGFIPFSPRCKENLESDWKKQVDNSDMSKNTWKWHGRQTHLEKYYHMDFTPNLSPRL